MNSSYDPASEISLTNRINIYQFIEAVVQKVAIDHILESKFRKIRKRYLEDVLPIPIRRIGKEANQES